MYSGATRPWNPFVRSRKVLSLIGMAQRYGKTPAEILFIKDEYTAYCLNEACAIIASKIDNKEEPFFEVKYKSFTELYADTLRKG